MFLFKKKKLVINCFTDRQDVATYAPIKPAHVFYPDWWKRLPKTIPAPERIVDAASMKYCIGMRDLYQHGIILPMWCDFSMDIGAVGDTSYRYRFADQQSSVQVHAPDQRGDFATEDLYQHLKIQSPWRLQCDEDVPFVWMEPTWNMDDLFQYKVLPSVVEFKYQHASHINMLAPRKKQEMSNLLIPFNTPLVQIMPLAERELDVRVIEDPKMFNRLFIARVSFVNSYKYTRAIDKRRCPAGFGDTP